MTIKVSAQGLSQYLIGAGIAIAALFLGGQQPGTAETAPAPENLSAASSTPIPIIPSQSLNPIVPPLDNPGLFLPSLEQPKRVILRLGQRRVYLYQGEQVIASYPVAVGKEGWETPTGNFKVMQKIENPVWQDPWTGEVRSPGPNTALGLRWIGFWTDGKDAIGFHGTPTVNSIGQAASHGCVRMRNEDVVALFEQVDVGTPVIVEP
ncbi:MULTISPECIES: L,D-transpeptidase [Planktothrix]|jgi:lipoprotein-anchoring transpeptidase ErfK/SrfK|uniref:ErfK/YbiS/YcfS/YnhG n=1 Tax=Planktothrix rubescens CCAP 1459/22 TaxID=329571 RepID=A0A6J7ZDQ9_PLARU|nr:MULTISPECIES: L,D-transpeptidase [Planktothrix]CAC5340799.1 ErfK/YbiS/YcfS/YnhG [Planktothrix rubescens NIVA-CYA 18]CAD5928527.1 Putative L,D-transpeptidase YqjB [Planktothrix rubescens]CAD5938411.1 Putative L,D-transpeptidase YqjB [Planktothrix rubescens NIVA-CYA 18]